MESSARSYNGEVDNPAALHYASWRSLLGHFVAIKERMPHRAPELGIYEVVDAIIGPTQVYLKVKRWPSGFALWVGGVREGMYAMIRRPDGGFQVAGEKFVLIGSLQQQGDEFMAGLESSFDSLTLSVLKARLQTPRGEVQMERVSRGSP